MENKEKAAASRLIKKYSIILILIALMIVLTMIKPQFIKPGNLVNMLRQISLVGILTMGMMLVILIGDIDISGGPQIALTSVICAYFASRECPLVLAFLMPLLAGLCCGLVNGVLTAKMSIPSFIATLGMMSVAKGLALIVSKGQPISGIRPEIEWLGSKKLMGIPVLVIVFIICAAVVSIMLQKTAFGKKIYALGGNQEAARVCGINVDLTRIKVFLLMSVFATISGILITGRVSSGSATNGIEYHMDAIASTVIGGVSMTGGSYLGYVQWAAAASGNPHLKAMLSNVCAGSPFVDVPRRGGCFNSGMLAWAFLVSGQHANPELMARDDWDDVLNIRPLEELAPKALGYDIPFLKKWLSHMDYDELWQRGNWKERTGASRVPALIMSGWFDDNGMGTTEALELYRDYPEKKVILGPWLHSGNASYDPGGLALGSNALRYDMDFICLAWLEHYLKGADNGIDRTPKAEYYTCGSNQWKTASNWPVPETKELVLYLDGRSEDTAASNGGLLTTDSPVHESSDSYLYNPEDPAVHLIDMSENELEVPADYAEEEKRSDVLCYTTECLTEDLTITGDATAEIFLSSDCEDTDLVVRITDVDEAGRSMKLADGVLCVRYRNQFDHPDFMESGTVYPVKIRTTKVSHTFLKGHRLRVTITSSAENFIFPNRNTRDGFNSVAIKTAHNRIHRGGSCASRVVLREEM